MSHLDMSKRSSSHSSPHVSIPITLSQFTTGKGQIRKIKAEVITNSMKGEPYHCTWSEIFGALVTHRFQLSFCYMACLLDTIDAFRTPLVQEPRDKIRMKTSTVPLLSLLLLVDHFYTVTNVTASHYYSYRLFPSSFSRCVLAPSHRLGRRRSTSRRFSESPFRTISIPNHAPDVRTFLTSPLSVDRPTRSLDNKSPFILFIHYSVAISAESRPSIGAHSCI